ncbi:hypothetical protein GTV32_17330 [Gordonia sp. SID5947]|uniref:hypothetical protein n=1 Tax=Gordonia sp. SID5947 TaxID=2690315 RepID=UPI00136A7A00|nr:hypothetical protein [Gordonia sp. SID5947]MYR07952.1 hypothetical protein [Gordonia sp. SID5947]
MTEVLMACVVYGENGFALTQRAITLATESDAPLHVLIFDSFSDDHDGDRLLELPILEQMAGAARGTVRHVRAQPDQMVEAIRRHAREVAATQILIGERQDGAILRAFGWTTAEEIMRAVPEADLHIVPVSRSQDPEWPYEPAVPATLTTDTAGTILRYGKPGDGIPGLFMRERETDFDNGVFLYERDGQVGEAAIVRGRSDDRLP